VGRALENTLAVLNGLVGDHLSRTKNGLETPMAFMRANEPILLDRASLAASSPALTGRIVVLVHGLMNTEACWELADGGDYGSYLARDAGFSPFYVRYNTGLPIADNGVALARLLDRLVDAYPVPIEDLLLLGYSMGGLVVRSACHEAVARTAPFLPHVKRAIYVGTPHLGAPYERAGRLVSAILHAIHDPYTRLIGDIADLRSAGLQDLGDADLRHEDRARRGVGVHLKDWRHPVPLLPGIKHHLIAGSLSDAPWLHELFGDALVPLGSALARDSESELSTPARVLQGRNHIALAHDPEVYEQIRLWAGESA
jgi:triacylglycerol lipase